MAEPLPLGLVPAFHAARDPRRPFVTQGEDTLSRGELEVLANRRARALAACGIGHDDFVVLLMPPGLEVFETSFALWKLGATPLPLSDRTTDAELAACIDLVRPRAVIGKAGGVVGDIGIPAGLPIDQSLSADAHPPVVAKYWRAAMTGGSTGSPKIIVDHAPSLCIPEQPMLGQQVDGVMLSPAPLYHSGPFGIAHRALFAGCHLVNMPRFDAADALRLIERHRVDWLYMVPTMMHRIWRLPAGERAGFDVSSLNVVFHMASVCPDWLKEAWIDWLGPEKIWELYSGAESPGRTIINGVEWLSHRGSVGRVQPGAELAIFDEDGNPCPTGEVGEVYFKSDGGREAAFHYIGAEGKWLGDWISLGDLGYLDAEGYLYIVDRRTDLIISGGVNVYPAEVESALDSHPGVGSSVVIGLPDPDLGQRVHAIVQTEPGASARLDEEALREFLAERLVRYKIPRTFEFVDQPLRDNAGKVRRSALREERIRAAAGGSRLEPTER